MDFLCYDFSEKLFIESNRCEEFDLTQIFFKNVPTVLHCVVLMKNVSHGREMEGIWIFLISESTWVFFGWIQLVGRVRFHLKFSFGRLNSLKLCRFTGKTWFGGYWREFESRVRLVFFFFFFFFFVFFFLNNKVFYIVFFNFFSFFCYFIFL